MLDSRRARKAKEYKEKAPACSTVGGQGRAHMVNLLSLIRAGNKDTVAGQAIKRKISLIRAGYLVEN